MTKKRKIPKNQRPISSLSRFEDILKIAQAGLLTNSQFRRFRRLRQQLQKTGKLPAHLKIVDTQRLVAESFKVSRRAAESWIGEGAPKRADGLYDLALIAEWRARRDHKKGDGETSEKNFWTTEYRKFKARLAELDVQEREGQIIPREEVEAGRVRRILTVKQALLGLGGKLAPRLYGQEIPDIQSIIDGDIREITTDFAEARPPELAALCSAFLDLSGKKLPSEIRKGIQKFLKSIKSKGDA